MEWTDREILVLTKKGVWLSGGSEISHEPTRALFSKSLVRDLNGYFLKIGHETKRVWVEDTAYFVIGFSTQRNPADFVQILLFLSDETEEILHLETISFRADRLSARVKDGAEEARFSRQAYLDFLNLLQEDENGYHLNQHYLVREPV